MSLLGDDPQPFLFRHVLNLNQLLDCQNLTRYVWRVRVQDGTVQLLPET